MLDLSNLAPVTAAAIIGGLFAFHNAPAVAEETEALSNGGTFAEILDQSRPMENCTAFTDNVLTQKYGANFFPIGYAKATCSCMQETAAHSLDQIDIPNKALRDALLTLVIDLNLTPQLGNAESELKQAIVDFVYENEDAEKLGFTADELEAALEEAKALEMLNTGEFNWNKINQFKIDYPICYEVAQAGLRHFLTVEAEIDEKQTAKIDKVLAIRAIEYDQGTYLEDIDAILASKTPMDRCEQYAYAFQRRRYPAGLVSIIEKDAADVCQPWINLFQHSDALEIPEAERNYLVKSFIAVLYIGAYGTTADKKDAKVYFENQHAAFGMSPEDYASLLAEIGESYISPFDTQAERDEKLTPRCPADMDFNYASVDLPRALENTYLP